MLSLRNYLKSVGEQFNDVIEQILILNDNDIEIGLVTRIYLVVKDDTAWNKLEIGDMEEKILKIFEGNIAFHGGKKDDFELWHKKEEWIEIWSGC